ncbi:MAG: hypothetical protein JST00_15570 [Deltaproteobacteria bacterium]|nr:hypothetical protein [Deltaproteobacteria bacterium]
MRLRLALLVASVASAAFAFASACSSFEDDPLPPPEAGAVEAGPDVAEGGGSDATSDAGGRFCATVDASFCADFDLDGIDGGGWNDRAEVRGGFTLVPSDRSAPNALQGAILTGDAGSPDADAAVPENAAAAALVKQLVHGARTSKVATLDFDIRVDAISPPALTFIGGMGFDPNPATSEFVSLYVNGSALAVVAENTPRGQRDVSKTLATTPGVGTWFHVTIELTYGGGTRVLVDGSQVFGSQVGLVDKTSDLIISLGPYQTAPSLSARFSYDNIVARDLP